jgi:hypothetical protein
MLSVAIYKGDVLLSTFSRDFSMSLSLLLLYVLVMLSTFSNLGQKLPLGSPKSISSLLRVLSLTLKVIELSSIKCRVAMTECIS